MVSHMHSPTKLGLLALQLGNFSYTVNMHADPAQSETLPQLEAALGSTACHVLQLQNPVGHEVVLQTSCSNPHNFTLSTSVTMPPYGEAEVAVEYLPSSLGTHAHNMLASYLLLDASDHQTCQLADVTFQLIWL